ncbi:hypothetical protein [Rossellomorea marisflavi]|uniref:hypothetical protein n=1 Tax=Rossellomorea marisflavi TaxID=189381 RepID=UPI003F9F1A33
MNVLIGIGIFGIIVSMGVWLWSSFGSEKTTTRFAYSFLYVVSIFGLSKQAVPWLLSATSLHLTLNQQILTMLVYTLVFTLIAGVITKAKHSTNE